MAAKLRIAAPAIHVDLNALDPGRPLGTNASWRFSATEALPLFDLGRDDRHQVKVALARVEPPAANEPNGSAPSRPEPK